MAGEINSNVPRVEGVNLVAYVGKGLDLNRVARLVGTYTTGIGYSTHDVYDLPTSALHPFAQDRVPDTIASNRSGTILRLYVPKSNHGQITDIGLINGVYAAPGAPYVPRAGGAIYCAPADQAKYLARGETRPPKTEHKSWGDPNWRPGPGDRFRVTEID
ncbi:MAG: hypothetical protein IPG45_28350 [Deltaproteobacteria bacterium]|nr:hypothetical protein [Deltaproteobacteria bacterium]